jgi:hypothetical protein
VAAWAKSVLGPGHRFIAPEAVGRELLVNGDQTPFVSSAPRGDRTVLFNERVSEGIVETLGSRSIDYVAIDRRVSGNDSMSGYFFPGHGDTEFLLPHIVVYDVRTFQNVPR